MKAGISDIKKALKEISKPELEELVLRLAKLKKQNKVFLDYLLFEADDKENYIQEIKHQVSEEFMNVNPNVYLAKKTLRKIIKIVREAASLLQSPEYEIALWIHYCQEFTNLSFNRSKLPPVVLNLYDNQIKRMEKLILLVHEDLQFDYSKEIKQLKR